MSYIPDCREDDAYNQKYLIGLDKEFVRGYDWAVERILDILDDDLEDIEDEFNDCDCDFNPMRYICRHEDVRKVLREQIEMRLEWRRDELITSMIDEMDEDVYNKIVEEVKAKESEKSTE